MCVMSNSIPFPLARRVSLIRTITDELEEVHGPAANTYWRRRIAAIVAGLRADGLCDDTIRGEILSLQDAVQCELRHRAHQAEASALNA